MFKYHARYPLFEGAPGQQASTANAVKFAETGKTLGGQFRAYCTSHGLPYTEATLIGSYSQALRHLNTIGRLTRRAPAAQPATAPIQP